MERMFLMSGTRLGGLALLIGLPISVLALRVGLQQEFIVGPEVNPWLVGLGVGAILLAVATAAAGAPARRAARTDPVRALREE